MDGVLDLERLLGRIALDSAGPRDVVALGSTIARLPALRSAALHFASGTPQGRWAGLCSAFDTLDDLHEIVSRTLVEEPPVSLSEGGAVRPQVDVELDELRTLSTSGRQRIAAIEERERERTGIASLKVRFNSVFGYYLEVTKANAKSVPADYERKQNPGQRRALYNAGAQRPRKQKILTAQERSAEIERTIFAELRRQLLAAATRVRETSRCIAELDLLACLAHVAASRGWVRPVVDESGTLEFIARASPCG